MSGNLRDFLVNLASSADLMTEFAADPAGVLDRAGLSAADKAAVLARDSEQLRRALGASAADHMTQVSTIKKKGAKKRRPGMKKASKKGRAGMKKR